MQDLTRNAVADRKATRDEAKLSWTAFKTPWPGQSVWLHRPRHQSSLPWSQHRNLCSCEEGQEGRDHLWYKGYSARSPPDSAQMPPEEFHRYIGRSDAIMKRMFPIIAGATWRNTWPSLRSSIPTQLKECSLDGVQGVPRHPERVGGHQTNKKKSWMLCGFFSKMKEMLGETGIFTLQNEDLCYTSFLVFFFSYYPRDGRLLWGSGY